MVEDNSSAHAPKMAGDRVRDAILEVYNSNLGSSFFLLRHMSDLIFDISPTHMYGPTTYALSLLLDTITSQYE